jgi:hypothetical protein
LIPVTNPRLARDEKVFLRGLWLRGSARNISRSGRVVLNSSRIEKDPKDTGRSAEIMTG